MVAVYPVLLVVEPFSALFLLPESLFALAEQSEDIKEIKVTSK
jgi:hypothetical protein